MQFPLKKTVDACSPNNINKNCGTSHIIPARPNSINSTTHYLPAVLQYDRVVRALPGKASGDTSGRGFSESEESDARQSADVSWWQAEDQQTDEAQTQQRQHMGQLSRTPVLPRTRRLTPFPRIQDPDAASPAIAAAASTATAAAGLNPSSSLLAGGNSAGADANPFSARMLMPPPSLPPASSPAAAASPHSRAFGVLSTAMSVLAVGAYVYTLVRRRQAEDATSGGSGGPMGQKAPAAMPGVAPAGGGSVPPPPKASKRPGAGSGLFRPTTATQTASARPPAVASTAAAAVPAVATPPAAAPATNPAEVTAATAPRSAAAAAGPEQPPTSPPRESGWWRRLGRVYYISFGAQYGLVPRIRLDGTAGTLPGSSSSSNTSRGRGGSSSAVLAAFEDPADAEYVANALWEDLVQSGTQPPGPRPPGLGVLSAAPIFLEDLAAMRGAPVEVVPSDGLRKDIQLSGPQLEMVLAALIRGLPAEAAEAQAERMLYEAAAAAAAAEAAPAAATAGSISQSPSAAISGSSSGSSSATRGTRSGGLPARLVEQRRGPKIKLPSKFDFPGFDVEEAQQQERREVTTTPAPQQATSTAAPATATGVSQAAAPPPPSAVGALPPTGPLQPALPPLPQAVVVPPQPAQRPASVRIPPGTGDVSCQMPQPSLQKQRPGCGLYLPRIAGMGPTDAAIEAALSALEAEVEGADDKLLEEYYSIFNKAPSDQPSAEPAAKDSTTMTDPASLVTPLNLVSSSSSNAAGGDFAARADGGSSSSSSKVGARRAWGAWKANRRIQEAEATLLSKSGTRAVTLPPPPPPAVAARQSPASPLSPAAPPPAAGDAGAAAGSTESGSGAVTEDGVVVVSKRVGSTRPPKVVEAPEARQDRVKEALRVFSELGSGTGDEEEQGEESGEMDEQLFGRSASLLAGGRRPWWQQRFQALFLPTIGYTDGSMGFMQQLHLFVVNVSLSGDRRDMRVLAFEDRTDCTACLTLMAQWPEYEGSEPRMSMMPTDRLLQQLQDIYDSQALRSGSILARCAAVVVDFDFDRNFCIEKLTFSLPHVPHVPGSTPLHPTRGPSSDLNNGVNRPRGLAVFRRGKLPMRPGMGPEEFVQVVVYQHAAQVALARTGYGFNA
ncbi:hypothetical protein VOLCADRAFT_105043 [Volvox carteri f. nagariensis]|uniref:Uncharacterized protein n=1 Tax=Volvox carteri f. nagariensis TaxID=3068 RepID=D8TY11_VOLCA|nr:uncharacterized protein VOLCADRAFT_105043 [Volvox carteri f. nagariensis]EFJ47469.1 hypothetical protein VOLCADRAFT_105043 [Volvox carteri f. nagariensis]|eukprot:XP_002951293.1 hypothetical protein VOLCADRAFT_105043 [Volvox carteri f. nagariensis]